MTTLSVEGERNLPPIEKDKGGEDLFRYGMLTTAGGVQIDINTVPRRLGKEVVDAHKCDHNCLRDYGAGYDCPAASMINKGLKSDFPEVAHLTKAIISASEGVRIGNELLVSGGHFEQYCREFRIPPEKQRQISGVLSGKSVSVNLFGGNPEMHNGLFELVSNLSKIDPTLSLNLTTTGRRSITHDGWIESLAHSHLSSIALSCDDINANILYKTSQMSLDDLSDSWKALRQANPLWGTKHKALEAIYTAKALDVSNMPITFNLVIHPGNIREIEELTGQLATQFPNAYVNPFPAQSSMDSSPPTFGKNDLPLLSDIVDWAIDVHIGNTDYFPLTPRLHYWLMLKSAFETYRGDAERIQHALSGYELWKCYQVPGAARYLQIGASFRPWAPDKKTAGMHLGCYWNQTVTEHGRQANNMNPDQIANYITLGISETSGRSPQPCNGCIMPRLTFDMYSQEVGMNPEIVPAYLELRKEHVGF